MPPKRKYFFSYILLYPLLVLFFYSPSVCGGEEAGIYVDESLQMELARRFFQEGDYYRAITEYKRFLFLFPASARAKEASFGIVMSYYQGKRWEDTIRSGNDFLKEYPSSELISEVLLMEGCSYMEEKDYPQARQVFGRILDHEAESSIRDKAQWQIAVTYLKEEKWEEAAAEFRAIQKNSNLFPKSEYFAQTLDQIGQLPQKSPATAGVLAAVLPGAGHLYCERYRDAAVAFLLNGAFIWGMVESFQHENYVVGGILTFFELGWYSGNIYSAVSSAHKFNRQKKKKLLDYLEGDSNLCVGFFWQAGKPVLALRYEF